MSYGKNVTSVKKFPAAANLVRGCEAARILGVSREYVRQMVLHKQLAPKYIFNASAWRNIYVFDRKIIERMRDPKERKKIKRAEWKPPVESDLMTASEVAKQLRCSTARINIAVQRGFLEPDLVIAGGKIGTFALRLYDFEKARAAVRRLTDTPTPIRSGHTQKTLALMEKIRKYYAKGYSDVQISKRIGAAQPFISKLRSEMQLISHAKIRAAEKRALQEEADKLKKKRAPRKKRALIEETDNLKKKRPSKKRASKKRAAK